LPCGRKNGIASEGRLAGRNEKKMERIEKVRGRLEKKKKIPLWTTPAFEGDPNVADKKSKKRKNIKKTWLQGAIRGRRKNGLWNREDEYQVKSRSTPSKEETLGELEMGGPARYRGNEKDGNA